MRRFEPADTPYHPSEELRQIDYRMTTLIQKRLSLSDCEQKPDTDTLKEWLGSDHKSVMLAHFLFRLISRGDELGPAVTAAKNEMVTAAESLMLETRWPGYRILLTHVEHYSTFSLVYSQLNADQSINGGAAIRILLDIKGVDASFVVEGHEMSGQGNRLYVVWNIAPRLPYPGDQLTWSLISTEKSLFPFPDNIESITLEPPHPLTFRPSSAS